MATNPAAAPTRSRRSRLRWWRPVYHAAFIVGAVLVSIFLIGLAQRIGWIKAPSGPPAASANTDGQAGPVTQYICPMMCTPPLNEPGRCPVCGMELVEAAPQGGSSDGRSVTVAAADRRLMGIKTVAAQSLAVDREIRGVGELEIDESRVARLAADTGGRVEALHINFAGQVVASGDPLVTLYAPDLYAAQTELLTLRRSRRSSATSRHALTDVREQLIDSARDRLIELGMSRDQVAELEASGDANTRVTITSPQSGTVTKLMVRDGQYIKVGDIVCEVADLSNVWLLTDLFPEDAALVRYGQRVQASVNSLPNQTLVGRVSFVHPMVDTETRTVRVRIEIPNPEGRLRPGDEATVQLSLPASPDNQIYDEELAGKWICPLHPDEIAARPGDCPRSGRPFVATSTFGYASSATQATETIVVPRNAILMVGDDAAVYVETGPGRYELRPVVVGASLGDRMVVLDGLQEGERVAASGNFLIDSQMQLAGNPSLIDASRLADDALVMDDSDSAEVVSALAELSPKDRDLAEQQRLCPVAGVRLGSMGVPRKVEVEGRIVFLCCDGCRARLLSDPQKYLEKLDAATAADEATEFDAPPIGPPMPAEPNASMEHGSSHTREAHE